MAFTFEPQDDQTVINVPFFEDARADFAPYYSSKASLDEAKSQVAIEMSKLGGIITGFQKGLFKEGDLSRHGYEIRFSYWGRAGVIRAAGLPIQKETPAKVERVLVQALLIVRDWLKSSVTARVFAPGSEPLLPHLLGDDGMTTLADMARADRQIQTYQLMLKGDE